MFVCCVMAAAVLVAAAVVVCRLIRRGRCLRAALVRERAASRLAAGQLCRDVEAFRDRVAALVADREVLVEADRVLDGALAGVAGVERREKGGPG